MPQGAHFLRLVVLLNTFVTEEGTQQAGKRRFWPKSFCGKGCMKIQSIPPGLLIRIPRVKGPRVPLKSSEQMNRTIPERECARTYLNYIIFNLNNQVGRISEQN